MIKRLLRSIFLLAALTGALQSTARQSATSPSSDVKTLPVKQTSYSVSVPAGFTSFDYGIKHKASGVEILFMELPVPVEIAQRRQSRETIELEGMTLLTTENVKVDKDRQTGILVKCRAQVNGKNLTVYKLVFGDKEKAVRAILTFEDEYKSLEPMLRSAMLSIFRNDK